jgi:hypothetical protein
LPAKCSNVLKSRYRNGAAMQTSELPARSSCIRWNIAIEFSASNKVASFGIGASQDGVPTLVVLGVVAGLEAAPVVMRLRNTLLVFGIAVGLCGIWMLIPALLAPKATSTWRTRAVVAARIGAVRGDLWAEAAFIGARLMWQDPVAGFDKTGAKQLDRVRANAESALAFAPINGAVWLLLAMLTQNSPEHDSRVATFLEMSYFTAPNDLSLAPLRVMRAATSAAMANKDIQLFIKNDIRGLLDRGPDHRRDIVAAYRDAWPQNQSIFLSLVAEIDPSEATLLSSPQSK